MGEGDALASSTARPTIKLPPRSSFDSWFPGGASGDSPGPLSLVSSFFSDNNYPDSCKCRSFTQLLAGAMASPVAVAAGLSPTFFMGNSAEDSVKEDGSMEDGDGENLGFKEKRPSSLVVARSSIFMVPPGMSPSGLLNSPGFFPPVQSPFGMTHQQALAQVTAHAVLSQSHFNIQTDHQHSMPSSSEPFNPAHLPSFIPNLESSEISNFSKKTQPPSIGKPADDGYNWRKYGQKHVKGSEFPRSYYKCTHLNCPVKKKVERSLKGSITEIIYKGKHSHELPQSNKHAKDSNDSDRNIVVPLVSNESMHTNSVQAPVQLVLKEDDSSDRRLHIGADDEPNPKKRSIEVGKYEPVPLPQKMVTEARIVVQTRSEVNLLDDGYRWRKYGQKIVKGNHHPRSYYKCTSQECKVRKQVERAVADPSAVITTYEGKHNHNIPLPKTTNHSISKSGLPKP